MHPPSSQTSLREAAGEKNARDWAITIKAESTPSVPHRGKESVLSVYGPNGLDVLFQPRGRGRSGWFVISGGRVTSASECPS